MNTQDKLMLERIETNKPQIAYINACQYLLRQTRIAIDTQEIPVSNFKGTHLKDVDSNIIHGVQGWLSAMAHGSAMTDLFQHEREITNKEINRYKLKEPSSSLCSKATKRVYDSNQLDFPVLDNKALVSISLGLFDKGLVSVNDSLLLPVVHKPYFKGYKEPKALEPISLSYGKSPIKHEKYLLNGEKKPKGYPVFKYSRYYMKRTTQSIGYHQGFFRDNTSNPITKDSKDTYKELVTSYNSPVHLESNEVHLTPKQHRKLLIEHWDNLLISEGLGNEVGIGNKNTIDTNPLDNVDDLLNVLQSTHLNDRTKSTKAMDTINHVGFLAQHGVMSISGLSHWNSTKKDNDNQVQGFSLKKFKEHETREVLKRRYKGIEFVYDTKNKKVVKSLSYKGMNDYYGINSNRPNENREKLWLLGEPMDSLEVWLNQLPKRRQRTVRKAG